MGIGGDEDGDARKPRVRYNPKGVGRALAAKGFPESASSLSRSGRSTNVLPLFLLRSGTTRVALCAEPRENDESSEYARRWYEMILVEGNCVTTCYSTCLVSG
jgi:hypothetical protein